jgi:hypothetical protein
VVAEFTRARLIPVSGIDSATEAETRAASAFLAVLGIVRPFSKALLDPIGAPRAASASVETFIEVIYDHDGRRVRPDGLIAVTQGSKPSWKALVEVKTGDGTLTADQVNMYWDIARAERLQAVITISNEMPPVTGVHPTAGLRVRANSTVQVHHLSWSQILSEAITQMAHRGVDDVEQGWILNELIRYLKHKSSGSWQFSDMGPAWVEVREAARNGTVDRRSEFTLDVVRRWDQLLQSAALRLGAEIGREVLVVLPNGRRVDPEKRAIDLGLSLANGGVLDGALRVPNAVSDIQIAADLKAQLLTTSVDVELPRDRGSRARVTWLVNQLGSAPERTVLEVWPRNARATTASAPLGAVQQDRTLLLGDNKELARVRIVQRSTMGVARKAGTKSVGFVDSVLRAFEEFYELVVQNLRPWQAPAPRRQALPDEPEVPVVIRSSIADAIEAQPVREQSAASPPVREERATQDAPSNGERVT